MRNTGRPASDIETSFAGDVFLLLPCIVCYGARSFSPAGLHKW